MRTEEKVRLPIGSIAFSGGEVKRLPLCTFALLYLKAKKGISFIRKQLIFKLILDIFLQGKKRLVNE